MTDYLAAKLGSFSHFSDADARIMRDAGSGRIRKLRAGETLIHEGQRPECVYLVTDGWACRCNVGADGKRVITGVFMPGDLCDVGVYLLQRMDHTVAALSAVMLVEIARLDCDRMVASLGIRTALMRDALVNASINRQWMLRVAGREALSRLAHLLCELCVRQRGGVPMGSTSCALPMRQAELADALGMTAVHVNRMLQELRQQGLIELRQKTLSIGDMPALSNLAGFNADYLHFAAR